jgi:hypothetical protein
MAFRPENVAGIYSIWKQIADLEARRLACREWNPAMARAIGRKILRRAHVLATLVARDQVEI